MNKKPTATVVTHGCRYNQVESAEIGRHLEEHGFKIVRESGDADLVVVNTCTVTSKSDHKSRRSIRRAAGGNKDAAIVATGCYSQMNPKEITRNAEVDLVLGNREKFNMAEYLERTGLLTGGRVRKAGGVPPVFVDGITSGGGFVSQPLERIPGRTKAFLKVQTGCGLSCSFCVVTLARGDSVSEFPDRVRERFRALIDAGFKEITLTGIHLGSYGRDLTPASSLSSLLKTLVNLKGDFRVRLSSIGPADIDDSLIGLMSNGSRVCPHLHLPLQSGDDEILRMMRRNYTVAEYEEAILKVTDSVPDIGIGADVIVGFPGETEERFRSTIDLIRRLPFSYLHVFPYSERPGTQAASMQGRVPGQVRAERAKEMKRVGLRKSEEFRRRSLGTVREALVEEKRDRVTDLLKGHTNNYIPVLMDGGDERMNSLAQVRLTRMEGARVLGEFL